MAGPAPTEQQEVLTSNPTKIDKGVYLPAEEERWRVGMAQHAEEATGQPFPPAEATPPAAQRVPTGKTGIQIQPGVNAAEPWIDTADMADIAGKTASHVVNLPAGDRGLSAPDETAPGHRGIFKLRERLGKLFRRK